MSDDELPLFPLGTVLFPEGPLPLKIFEARYVDMVSRCARESKPFGVTLLFAGDDAGTAQLAEIGTSARIVDWNQGSDGLLYITAEGERRFRIRSVRQQEDGLHLAVVEWMPEEEEDAPSKLLDETVAVIKSMLVAGSELEQRLILFSDDATRLGFRLAELLPLALETRQRCLEMSSAAGRIELLRPILQKVADRAMQTREQ